MSGRLELDVAFAQPQAQPVQRRRSEGPMRILFLGDFSGRQNRGLFEIGDGLAQRPIVQVDVDELERVLAGYWPRLSLGLERGSTSVELELGEMEDFHPDRLYDALPLFQELARQRRRLQDPSTFAAAAAELIGGADPGAAPAPPPAAAEDDADTIGRLLGQRPVGTPRARGAAAGGSIEDLVRRLVAPHVVPAPDPRQDRLLASVDAALTAQMRGLLHDGDFQALEAVWRSLQRVVTGVETDADLQLWVLDVSQQELQADLGAAAADLAASGLCRALRQQSGGQPWSVLVGDGAFGPSGEELELLARLGAVGSRVGAPFLGAARPSLVGCSSWVEAPDPSQWRAPEPRWNELRQSPVARWIGLFLPRVLLRLPYGPAGDPIERFGFVEMPDPRQHAALLWGSSAFAAALLLARSFRDSGWQMQPGEHLEVDDLPTEIYAADGERKLQAGAEAFLSERAGEALLQRGLCPLLSYRNRNAARLLRFQSIADPPAALAGPWG